MSSADPRKLAQSGKFEELVALWESGERFDLKMVFQRAVTDFRTVKRRVGHARILEFCVDQGLEIELEVIEWVAKFGNHAILEYLAEKELLAEADPFVAAYMGNASKLAKAGLAELRDSSGRNLLHAAAMSGLGRTDASIKVALSDTCAYLIGQGVSASAVVALDVPTTPAYCCAAFGGNSDIMKQLLASGQVDIANLHLELEFALEPHQRSGLPFYDVAQEILDQGFDLNCIRPNQGRTLLHGCANRGTKKAVAWLLEKGSNPNALDLNGNTPLHVAAQRNTYPGVIEALIAAGADITAVDGDGQTALEIAKANGRDRLVDCLRSYA